MKVFRSVIYVIIASLLFVGTTGLGWYEEEHKCCNSSEIHFLQTNSAHSCSVQEIETTTCSNISESCCGENNATEKEMDDDCCSIEFVYSKNPFSLFHEFQEKHECYFNLATAFLSLGELDDLSDSKVELFLNTESPPKLIISSFIIYTSHLKIGSIV